MPKLNDYSARKKERIINNANLCDYVPAHYQVIGKSVKRWPWEDQRHFPNSKLDYKVPFDVIDKWNNIKLQQHGLFNMDINYANCLFTIEDIRKECAKHFTDKTILAVCNSPEKFDEFIYWSFEYIKELKSGILGGPHNSTLHAAYLFNVDVSTLNNEYIKKTVLPPKRKLINELKKYITIYSLNRIPCITEKLQEDGVITLYQCDDGIETNAIRVTAFNFYNIIMEQKEYLKAIQPRDGRRVYVVGTCDFKK